MALSLTLQNILEEICDEYGLTKEEQFHISQMPHFVRRFEKCIQEMRASYTDIKLPVRRRRCISTGDGLEYEMVR